MAISAFVGHSFSDGDREVVAAVLECLQVIKESTPGFNWVHAQRPEPTLVAEKVLALINGRDFFIGVCTRKERVISSVAPNITILGRTILSTNDLEWKTSDWIIQEIGLAIGKNLKIILLIEDGVRKPGGLQGDLEYIPFTRDNPQHVLGPLLLMLNGKKEEMSTGGPESSDEKTKEIGTQEVIRVSEMNTQDDFDRALLMSVALRDEEHTEEVNKAFLAHEVAQAPAAIDRWKAYREYLLLIFGATGSLERLKSKCASSDARTISYLARAYRHLGEHGLAAEEFERAAQQSISEDEKAQFLAEAVSSYQANNDTASANNLLNTMREKHKNSEEGSIQVLLAQLSVANARKDEHLAIAALEQLVHKQLDNDDRRFELAFKYSQIGNDRLAAFHYSKIRERVRNGTVWNNLGVSLNALRLPARSISSYRKSEDLGETLAMSNLAYEFLKAGFIPEARAICDKATKIEDYNPNVDEAQARIKAIPNEEEKREQEEFEKAKIVSSFYQDLGLSLIATPIPGLAETLKELKDEVCSLEVHIDETDFSAEGKYVRTGLRRLLGSESEDRTMIRSYKGRIHGRAIVGAVRSRDEGVKVSLLGDEPELAFLGIIVSSSLIKVMHLTDPVRIKFLQAE